MQWNIGGGRIRKQDADPTDVRSYSIESISYLAELALRYRPDIITLQETHQSPDGRNHGQTLAEALGFEFWINDTHDESHIEKGKMFGQAIVSRFCITGHSFKRLPNPNLTVVSADGIELRSHDYGITSLDMKAPQGNICVQTLHLPALHFFGITPDMQVGKDILSTISQAIRKPACPTIISGDYNLDALFVLDLLPSLRNNGFEEAPTDSATTPNGKRLDHIVHCGFQNVITTVIGTALTDHYPVLADFDAI